MKSCGNWSSCACRNKRPASISLFRPGLMPLPASDIIDGLICHALAGIIVTSPGLPPHVTLRRFAVDYRPDALASAAENLINSIMTTLDYTRRDTAYNLVVSHHVYGAARHRIDVSIHI